MRTVSYVHHMRLVDLRARKLSPIFYWTENFDLILESSSVQNRPVKV